jgi:hypothetical protein
MQGWKCPVCSVVHAPHVVRCDLCSPHPCRAVHYGVKYDDSFTGSLRHPDCRLGAMLGCGSPIVGAADYAVTRDWNLVTCRRCMKSRAVAAGPPTFAAVGISGSAHVRMSLIATAPGEGDEPIVASPSRPSRGCWELPPD